MSPRRLAVAAGFLGPLALALVLVPFRISLAPPAAALLLVIVIVAVALLGGRAGGVVASMSAAAWFDFFLTAPYLRFAITRRPDLETTICLLFVGLAVTEIAARSRAHREVADEEAQFVALIHEFSDLVARGARAEFVIARAATELTSLLGLRECRFATTPSKGNPARIQHSGEVVLGILRWGTQRSGLPGREVELLVQHRGRVYGRFAMVPTPGLPVPVERLVVAASVADQVGTAVADQARSA